MAGTSHPANVDILADMVRTLCSDSIVCKAIQLYEFVEYICWFPSGIEVAVVAHPIQRHFSIICVKLKMI